MSISGQSVTIDDVALVRIDDVVLVRLETDYKQLIYCAVGRDLSNKEDRNDAFAETMTAFIAKKGQIIVLSKNFESYIYAVARNKALEILRANMRWKGKLDRLAELAPTDPTEPSELEEAEQQQQWRLQLQKAIATLPERYQKVVKLLMSGDSAAECAKALDVSVENWYQLSRRTKIALRRVLDI